MHNCNYPLSRFKGEKLAALSPRDEKHAAPSPVGEGWEGGCNKTGIDGVSGYQGRPTYFTSQMTFVP